MLYGREPRTARRARGATTRFPTRQVHRGSSARGPRRQDDCASVPRAYLASNAVAEDADARGLARCRWRLMVPKRAGPARTRVQSEGRCRPRRVVCSEAIDYFLLIALLALKYAPKRHNICLAFELAALAAVHGLANDAETATCTLVQETAERIIQEGPENGCHWIEDRTDDCDGSTSARSFGTTCSTILTVCGQAGEMRKEKRSACITLESMAQRKMC